MKRVLFFVMAVILVSCHGEAIESTRRGDFKIELLFEKDGCKMYRFYDERYVYWSTCEGKVSSDYTTRSGKTSTTHHIEAITSVHE